jgi:hypothetical protein
MFQNPKIRMKRKHKKEPNRFTRPVKAKMSSGRNMAVPPERELSQLVAPLKISRCGLRTIRAPPALPAPMDWQAPGPSRSIKSG